MFNSKRQSNRVFATIILVLFLFSLIPVNDLVAQEADIPEPVYVDQDMLEITVEENSKKDEYKIGAEYINYGGVDWIVHIIKLKPEDIASRADLNKKANDKRAVFPSEATDIETIYVPANSAWKILDVVSFLIDTAVSFIIDDQDTAVVPKDEDAVYLIRAYSGSFGLQDDKEEQQFVIDDVDLGQERNNNARIINIFSGVVDASSLLFTFSSDMNNDPEIKKIILLLVEELRKNSAIQAAKGANGNITVDEVLIKINDYAGIFAEEMVKYTTNKLVDKAQKEATAKAATKATKFIAKSAKAALNTVNVLQKISKGGQILNRAYTLAYSATPLETAYIVNKELPEGEEVGYIEGKLGYPSEYVPNDMEICALNIGSDDIYCTDNKKDASRYEIEVPTGEYAMAVFREYKDYKNDDLLYVAVYTSQDKCRAECSVKYPEPMKDDNWSICNNDCYFSTSELLTVKIESGEIAYEINPADYLAQTKCDPLCGNNKNCYINCIK